MSEPRRVFVVVELTEEEARTTKGVVATLYGDGRLATHIADRLHNAIRTALARKGEAWEAWEGREYTPNGDHPSRVTHSKVHESCRRVLVVPLPESKG